jgi:hypothetical protein
MGSYALFATQATGVHSATRTDRSARTSVRFAQNLTKFRPQAFSASRRLAPPAARWPCFMPLPRAGFVPTGGFPLRQPHQARRPAVPSCRYHSACQKRRQPKPAALPSAARTDFRALLRLRVRSVAGRCYSFRRADPLMGFKAPLPGSSPSARCSTTSR